MMVLDKKDRFLENVNFAFLSDRLAIEAMGFLDKGLATPSTLFALNNLVQAVVLHDHLIVGLSSMAGSQIPDSTTIREKLGNDISPCIVAPEFDHLGENLNKNVFYWIAPDYLPAIQSTANEIPMLSVLIDFLHVGTINDLVIDEDQFCEQFGVSAYRGGPIRNQQAFNSLQSRLAIQRRESVTPDDLLALRDQAGMVAAGVSISKATGRDFYHSLHERPLIANEMSKHGPKKLLHLMESELYEDSSIGIEDIDIPPFLGMLMTRPGDWVENFWEKALELREEHHNFRRVYGDFQTEWKGANRGEQRKLKLEYDRAWNALLKKEEYLCEKRISHMALQALTTGGKSLADMMVEVDRFDQAISRVGGLVPLWKDMNSITSQNDARKIISEKCSHISSGTEWRGVVQGIHWAQSAIEKART
ncbi:hypothetical protein [Vreelandella boliviensis]|uniref:Uncharacterized protein n=1 Tax=Vreelandella boliviensis LC1 TaxID=1072583 RepID=A0A265DT67_9GAMM|nr:hypothetical protein [Halomonas boliviensis]EHJ91476.1 hypothetical protein KUC_3026 [Halomonas boliviensis LC1]OZT72519.1 hypothetical protein CE457_18995 [Halomonas boliviensis LC1]